jgi:hypothetical protein
MEYEELIIKELQSVVHYLRMALRRYHWNDETDKAKTCEANIKYYEQQLKTMQDERAKA